MNLPHIELAWSDLLDIVLTSYIVYLILLLIRGTRAVQILQGIALLVLLRLMAQFFHLWTIFSILNGLLIASGVAIPVVFQPEIRRALAQLGRARFFQTHPWHHDPETVEEVCAILGQTASVLARSAIGAIIVVERNIGLAELVESGTNIGGYVTTELLLSLFSPRSPLHDGAVIVRRDRIVAAGCFLPLSEAGLMGRRLGTRHRAALGISEQTDAIALVISEETGGAAIARDGKLSDTMDSADGVAKALRAVLSPAATLRRVNFVDQVRTLWTKANGAARLDQTQLRP
ncbi:MAG: TIGR00159 family protein [Candidatus Eremiobacteraeota bacterium]|nr:TIGR00159 family protein [Candidatus Eremiobacteraeota bacterium]MBC5827428.1 TIGR00159 family protein [Candidatus Eremiobacteraeota bacterium]